MAIRYTCATCAVVMKIKEEKAGSSAKCPQCKTAFVVPVGSRKKGRDDASPENAANDPIEDADLPLELTPQAEVSDDHRRSATVLSSVRSAAPGIENDSLQEKPSVASLMRDFAASGQKAKKPKSVRETTPVSTAQTTGTAAEALERAYQQKRASAGNPKPKPPRISEDQRLMLGFFARAIPLVLGALIGSYALLMWVTRDVYHGPPLVHVAGTLTKNGVPMAGMRVRLVPVLRGDELVSTGDKDAAPQRNASAGLTDAEGKFVMMYTALIKGSTMGSHTLEVTDTSGIPLSIPEEIQNQDVPETGISDLVINLK